MTNKLVYSKKSNIQGTGLYAYRDIKTGEKLVNYVGKLVKKNDYSSADSLRTLEVGGNFLLVCGEDDLASFCNDAIDYSKKKRRIVESLKSIEPFYKRRIGVELNASINIDENKHTAWLTATKDIKKDQEIACHYGFSYWYLQEAKSVGFLPEEEIEKNGFPTKIHEYPAFKNYIKEFYPKCYKFECINKDVNADNCSSYNIKLNFPLNNKLMIQVPNLKKLMEKKFVENNFSEFLNKIRSVTSQLSKKERGVFMDSLIPQLMEKFTKNQKNLTKESIKEMIMADLNNIFAFSKKKKSKNARRRVKNNSIKDILKETFPEKIIKIILKYLH